MAVDGLILEYIIYILIALFTFTTTEIQFSWRDFAIGTFASGFQILGKICIVLAVSYGIAGPAASLANTQTIYATLLSTIVSQQSLSILEICGLICGITGASVISLGDYIYVYIIKKIWT